MVHVVVAQALGLDDLPEDRTRGQQLDLGLGVVLAEHVPAVVEAVARGVALSLHHQQHSRLVHRRPEDDV